MNLQALLIRATVLLATCLIVLGALTVQPHHLTMQPQQTSQKPSPTVVAESAVTLPTIHVRPTAARLVKAVSHSVSSDIGAGPVGISVQTTIYETPTPSLANPRLDMPYYSFGKASPRIGKE